MSPLDIARGQFCAYAEFILLEMFATECTAGLELCFLVRVSIIGGGYVSFVGACIRCGNAMVCPFLQIISSASVVDHNFCTRGEYVERRALPYRYGRSEMYCGGTVGYVLFGYISTEIGFLEDKTVSYWDY